MSTKVRNDNTLNEGQTVTVMEERQHDGHERIRIGEGRWISRVTSKGTVLAQPIHPIDMSGQAIDENVVASSNPVGASAYTAPVVDQAHDVPLTAPEVKGLAATLEEAHLSQYESALRECKTSSSIIMSAPTIV